MFGVLVILSRIFSRGVHSIVFTDEMKKIDKYCEETLGLNTIALMENTASSIKLCCKSCRQFQKNCCNMVVEIMGLTVGSIEKAWQFGIQCQCNYGRRKSK